MGIHLILYKVDGDQRHRVPEWDTLRYAGDDKFLSPQGPEWIRHYDTITESGLYRPRDFNASRLWVAANIVPGNQPRLLSALDIMEKDDNIWIFISY